LSVAQLVLMLIIVVEASKAYGRKHLSVSIHGFG
jgi:hypothetical protein